MNNTLLFALLLFGMAGWCHATTYYFMHTAGNWSSTSQWSTVSDKSAARVSAAATPGANDTTIFDDYSGSPVTIDTSAPSGSCTILDCVSNGNYAGTFQFNSSKYLYVYSAVTLSGTTTFTGPGYFSPYGNNSLVSNGANISCNFAGRGSGATTYTFGDNWTTTASVAQDSGTAVWNGFTVMSGGSLTGTTAISGSTTLGMNGAGTLSTASPSVAITNPMTILSGANVTIGATLAIGSGGIFSAASGATITGTGSVYSTGNCTFNTGTVSIPNLNCTVSCAVTHLSALSIASTFQDVTSALTFVGNYPVTTTSFYMASTNSNRKIYFPPSQDFVVTTNLRMGSTNGTMSMESSTPSTQMNLKYLGTAINSHVYECKFVDVNATGSSCPINDYNPGTITNSPGIVPISLPMPWGKIIDGTHLE